MIPNNPDSLVKFLEIRLTKEEKKIEGVLLRGEYAKVTGKKLEEISQSLATRKKDSTMTIRVNSEDIRKRCFWIEREYRR